MKIITVCGSLKYKEEIMKITEEMGLKGNCMLSIVYPTKSDLSMYSKEQLIILKEMHKERIRISDAILVVDIYDYIGDSTKNEIEFAESLNKEVIYYSNLSKEIK